MSAFGGKADISSEYPECLLVTLRDRFLMGPLAAPTPAQTQLPEEIMLRPHHMVRFCAFSQHAAPVAR